MYLATLVSLISMPSLSNAPWMWRSRSRKYFRNLHVLYLLSKGVAENLIVVAEQIARDLIKRK